MAVGSSVLHEESGPVARSPFARRLAAGGAELGRVGEWEVALRCPGDSDGGGAAHDGVCVADISCVPKRAYFGAEAAPRLVAEVIGGEDQAEPPSGVVLCSADSKRLLCVLSHSEVVVIDQDLDRDAIGDVDGALFAVDRTGGWGSLALRGARVKALLERAAAFDTSEAVFPVGRCAVCRVAEVRALLVHVARDYYQLHVERADAEHLWDALFEAGRPVGIRPIGWNAYRALCEGDASAVAPCSS